MDNWHDTHWTRILHYDLFTGESAGTSSRTIDVDAPVRHSSPAYASRTQLAASPSSRLSGERVALTAADGYPLAGTYYAAAGATRATLVVAGAVGVPQRFYRSFAEFAAAAGYATMTFDYRGIGLSAPTDLREFRMDYFDWGRLDLAEAVAATAFPGLPQYVVGHGFGGHAFGFLPNHRQVAAFYTFGTGAGWYGWMSPLERVKALAMWHVLGPMLVRKGYVSWSALGLGEDLPIDFYRQWKRWCGYPRYFFDDPAAQSSLRGFAQVRAPLMAANSFDDPWAPPKSRDAFVAEFANAQRQVLDIDPAQAGLPGIGHMGYFKPNAIELWDTALAWLDACRGAPAHDPVPDERGLLATA